MLWMGLNMLAHPLHSVSCRNSFEWKSRKIHHYTMKCLLCELNITSLCQQCFPQQHNVYATTKTITTTNNNNNNNNNNTATAAAAATAATILITTTTVPAFMLTVCIVSVRICFLACCCHMCLDCLSCAA